MSWHIGDYLKDTGHLRAIEHGAYFLLCMHYWANGGLPNDDRQLAGIARMTDREWKLHRAVLLAFFKGEGEWRHKRIDEELEDAQEKYEKLSRAGRDGNAKRWRGDRQAIPMRSPGDPDAIADVIPMRSQPITDNPKEEDSEANASDAIASDPRSALFGRGLETLARITGKTPDSCRSLVGKWLKSVDDEAIHVLGAIDDAERNRVADPVAWINKSLQPRKTNYAETGRDSRKNDFSRTLEQMRAYGRSGGGGTGGGDVRLLPAAGCERSANDVIGGAGDLPKLSD